MITVNPNLLVDIFGESMPIEAAAYLLTDSAKTATESTLIRMLRGIRNDVRSRTQHERPLYSELVARARRMRLENELDIPHTPYADQALANVLSALDEITFATLQIDSVIDGFVAELKDGSRVFCEDMVAVNHVRENLPSPIKSVVAILYKGLPRDA